MDIRDKKTNQLLFQAKSLPGSGSEMNNNKILPIKPKISPTNDMSFTNPMGSIPTKFNPTGLKKSLIPLKKLEIKLKEFLVSIGLEKYESTLEMEDILTWDTFIECNDNHLRMLGFSVGNIVQIRKKISESNPKGTSEQVSPSFHSSFNLNDHNKEDILSVFQEFLKSPLRLRSSFNANSNVDNKNNVNSDEEDENTQDKNNILKQQQVKEKENDKKKENQKEEEEENKLETEEHEKENSSKSSSPLPDIIEIDSSTSSTSSSQQEDNIKDIEEDQKEKKKKDKKKKDNQLEDEEEEEKETTTNVQKKNVEKDVDMSDIDEGGIDFNPDYNNDDKVVVEVEEEKNEKDNEKTKTTTSSSPTSPISSDEEEEDDLLIQNKSKRSRKLKKLNKSKNNNNTIIEEDTDETMSDLDDIEEVLDSDIEKEKEVEKEKDKEKARAKSEKAKEQRQQEKEEDEKYYQANKKGDDYVSGFIGIPSESLSSSRPKPAVTATQQTSSNLEEIEEFLNVKRDEWLLKNELRLKKLANPLWNAVKKKPHLREGKKAEYIKSNELKCRYFNEFVSNEFIKNFKLFDNIFHDFWENDWLLHMLSQDKEPSLVEEDVDASESAGEIHSDDNIDDEILSENEEWGDDLSLNSPSKKKESKNKSPSTTTNTSPLKEKPSIPPPSPPTKLVTKMAPTQDFDVSGLWDSKKRKELPSNSKSYNNKKKFKADIDITTSDDENDDDDEEKGPMKVTKKSKHIDLDDIVIAIDDTKTASNLKKDKMQVDEIKDSDKDISESEVDLKKKRKIIQNYSEDQQFGFTGDGKGPEYSSEDNTSSYSSSDFESELSSSLSDTSDFESMSSSNSSDDDQEDYEDNEKIKTNKSKPNKPTPVTKTTTTPKITTYIPKPKRKTILVKSVQDVNSDTLRIRKKEEEESQRIQKMREERKGSYTRDNLLIFSSTSGIKSKSDDVLLHPDVGVCLKPHQLQGVRFLWDNVVEKSSGCILAHSMGLGKSLQVVAFIHTHFTFYQKKSILTKYLLIVPANTFYNWKQEFIKWFPKDNSGEVINPIIYLPRSKTHANHLEFEQWSQTGGVLVLTYETYVSFIDSKAQFPVIEKILKTDIVIIDEGHKIKSTQTKTSYAMSQIHTHKRVILTGYPLQNNLKEYFTMIDFIRPKILGTEKEFIEIFLKPIQAGAFANATPAEFNRMRERLAAFNHQIKDFIFRLGPEILEKELPKKYEKVILVDSTPIQKNLLRTLQAEKRMVIEAQEVASLICNHPDTLLSKKPINIKHIQKQSVKDLKKILIDNNLPTADCFEKKDLVDRIISLNENLFKFDNSSFSQYLESIHYRKGILENSSKFVIFFRLLEKCVEAKERVCLFTSSIATLNLLEYFLQKQQWKPRLDYYRLDGSTPPLERQTLIEKFNDQNIPVKLFLISTKAGSLGTNLTGGTRVVIFDLLWNPVHERQAVYRCFRIGQQKPVYVYTFIIAGSFEHNLYPKLIFKQSLAKRAIDLETPKRVTDSTVTSLNTTFAVSQDLDSINNNLMSSNDTILKEVVKENIEKIINIEDFHSYFIEDEYGKLTEEEEKAAIDKYRKELYANRNPPTPTQNQSRPHAYNFQKQPSLTKTTPLY